MKLIVKRKVFGPDLLRPYKLYLDGTLTNKLYISKPVSIDLEKEFQELFLKIDWIQSKKIDLTGIDADNDLILNIGVNPIFKISIIFMLGGVLFWDITHIVAFKLLAVIGFVTILYFYSFGRKNYFDLTFEN